MPDETAAVPVVELLDRDGLVIAHFEPDPGGAISEPLEPGSVDRIRYVLEQPRPDHPAKVGGAVLPYSR